MMFLLNVVANDVDNTLHLQKMREREDLPAEKYTDVVGEKIICKLIRRYNYYLLL